MATSDNRSHGFVIAAAASINGVTPDLFRGPVFMSFEMCGPDKAWVPAQGRDDK